MKNQQTEKSPISEQTSAKPFWQTPKLTKHGDIASLTKQWPGPDGLLPNAPAS